VTWAMLMLALFDAAGVLVPTPQPPKIFRPGCAVRHAIFFALSVMALFLSYSGSSSPKKERKRGLSWVKTQCAVGKICELNRTSKLHMQQD